MDPTSEPAVANHFPEAGRVLTVGCGAGRETFALERRGYDVVGVDLCPPLLDIARTIGAERHHRAVFHLCDGATLPFPDAAFDSVTLWAQVLDNVPLYAGRVDFLREVRRVLRAGGVASYSVHDLDRMRPLLERNVVVAADAPEPGTSSSGNTANRPSGMRTTSRVTSSFGYRTTPAAPRSRCVTPRISARPGIPCSWASVARRGRSPGRRSPSVRDRLSASAHS
ncbi:MAG: class I SAM-dependent methyltransferase [Gemmatimonadaceae bacterium]